MFRYLLEDSTVDGYLLEDGTGVLLLESSDANRRRRVLLSEGFMIVRQSTARIVTVGPVLDASGVAVTDGVVADFKISKNGGIPAALNASATLTHRHTGHYSLSLTATDLDTVGSAEIVIDDTVNVAPPKVLTVVEEATYDITFAAASTGAVPSVTGAVGSVTGAVGSVTGNVGGNVTGSVGSVVGHTAQTGDAFARLGAPAGASVSADVAAVKAETATILADTNDLQARTPAALVGGRMDASVGAMAANVVTATAIAADAITDAKVAADVTIASVTGAVGSVTGNVGGNVTGSVGSVATGGITAASIAADAFTAAKFAADVTTELQTGLATSAALATVSGLVDDLEARLGVPSNLGGGATIAANLVDIENQTDDIGVAGAGLTALGDTRLANLDAAISTRLATAGYTAPPSVGAIADQVWDEATVGHTTVGTFGEQLKTDVDAILADTGTDGVIVVTNNDKTGYALGVGGLGATAIAVGAINASALNADAVDEILDEQIGDGTLTLRQAMKIVVAALAGKVSGAGTASITIRNYADTTDVVVGAVDGAGNRTSTTVTV